MKTLEHETQLPQPSEDWIPDGTIINAIAKRYDGVDDGLWEVSFVEFAVVGRGDSLRSATNQAVEQLDDYFRLSALDGKTFAESRRPMPVGWQLRELSAILVDKMLRKLHRSAKVRFLRFPADTPPIVC